ncbi:hypothetical protein PO379_16780 [Enterobacter asburiae]|nr:hypothetical protein [Enterobacter asburiae]
MQDNVILAVIRFRHDFDSRDNNRENHIRM